MSDRLKAICSSVLNEFEFVTEDRPLEKDLRQFITHIQQRHWSLY